MSGGSGSYLLPVSMMNWLSYMGGNFNKAGDGRSLSAAREPHAREEQDRREHLDDGFARVAGFAWRLFLRASIGGEGEWCFVCSVGCGLRGTREEAAFGRGTIAVRSFELGARTPW
jgi:hypothetical protein